VDTAALVLDLADARPPMLGTGRLVCIDGPGGSGKSTLAAAIAARRPGTVVVHMDDLYDGWSGLLDVHGQLDDILLPLVRGEPGSYVRYDWDAGRFAERVNVSPTPLLVLEGVASGVRSHAHLASVTVWVTAPAQLRLRRGLERDGLALRDQWQEWMRDEKVLFAREGVAGRADVVVDGTGVTPPVLRRA
jgi:uridine kinase